MKHSGRRSSVRTFARSTTRGSRRSGAGSARSAARRPIATTSCKRSSWSCAGGSTPSTAPTPPDGCTGSPAARCATFAAAAGSSTSSPSAASRIPTSSSAAPAVRPPRSSAGTTSGSCSPSWQDPRRAPHDLRAVRDRGPLGRGDRPHPERSAQHRLDPPLSRAQGLRRPGRAVPRGAATHEGAAMSAGDDSRAGDAVEMRDPPRLTEESGVDPWLVGLVRSTGPYRSPPGRKQRVLLSLGRSNGPRRAPLVLRPAIVAGVLIGCGAFASAALGPWRGWIGRTYERLVPSSDRIAAAPAARPDPPSGRRPGRRAGGPGQRRSPASRRRARRLSWRRLPGARSPAASRPRRRTFDMRRHSSVREAPGRPGKQEVAPDRDREDQETQVRAGGDARPRGWNTIRCVLGGCCASYLEAPPERRPGRGGAGADD